MEVLQIRPPDDEHRDTLLAFFGHKGKTWLPYIRESVAGELVEQVQDHYFLGLVDGEPLGGMWFAGSTANQMEVVTLGHVFTRERARGRGVSSGLTERVKTFFRDSLRGRAIYLATGFGFPRKIYEKADWKSVQPGSTVMRWIAQGPKEDEAFEQEFFAPGALCKTRIVNLGDLGSFEALLNARTIGMTDAGLGLFSPGHFEEQLLTYIRDPNVDPLIALETQDRHRVVGMALVRRQDRRQRSHVGSIEFALHPAYGDYFPELLQALRRAVPQDITHLRAFAMPDGHPRVQWLSRAGFEKKAEESHQVCTSTDPVVLLPLQTWALPAKR